MQEHSPVEQPGASSQSMAWDAWGNPAEKQPLSPDTRSLLRSVLGISADAPMHGSDPRSVQLQKSELSPARLGALVSIVGVDNVSIDDGVRVLHLGGKSTPDLLTRRSGSVQDAPDAVVFPADEDEIAALLEYCSAESIAVVPFGGGTSVVGGVDPVREWFDVVVSVDLRRLDGLIDVDELSRTATLQAGVTGPQAEEMLGSHGLTLGHYPQSFEYATIGGFAATRSSGQASAGYGRFDAMVVGLTVVTPIGVTVVGTAPASAAGPDLRQVFLGSEGTLGIITSVTVRVHPVPDVVEYRSWRFPDFARGVEAFRALAAAQFRPTVMRLSDEAETGIDAARSGTADGEPIHGCRAIATFAGARSDTETDAERADGVIRAAGGIVVDPTSARAWEQHRFAAPYLRDALLDVGAFAETLETAASWSTLGEVRTRVQQAVVESLTAAGTPPLVLCHISHVYDTGASLYFTVVCASGDDPIGTWRAAKSAATTAMTTAGVTITHHHAVGRDHRPWMPAEVGPVGVALLRAMKTALDPAGVLNPGKLIP